MSSIHPYLTFDGNCEEAFNFYKSVFGGDIPFMGRFRDMLPDPNFPVPDDMMDKVMHVSMPIGDHTVLMGSDSSEAFGKATVQGNNYSISISTDAEEDALRIFNALSIGGKITMPIDKTIWGVYR